LLFGLGLLCNFLLPWGVYRLSEPHVGEAHAIMISAAVPVAWSLIEFTRNRKVDLMSALVLSAIGLSLLAIVFGGSPKLLLFRESLVTGLIGLVMIGSALIRRPLMLVLVTAVTRSFGDSKSGIAALFANAPLAHATEQLESFAGKPWFRSVMTAMTVVVGLILIAETAARWALIFYLPTEKVLLLGPVVRYAAVGLLLILTFAYFVPSVRRGRVEDEG